MITGKAATGFFRAAIVLLAAACSSGTDSSHPAVDPTELNYAASLGVNLSQMTRTPSGLYYKDEVVGGGAAAAKGSSVTVDYTGWLHTGKQFDSSVGKQPFTINRLGNGEVIPGWDEGLVGARAGGRRLLVIPSSLAYGAGGAGDVIPPNATLVFRIDVRSVR
jgi:FKBP-type peptidyl-prolyl cis-trans isomerase FkpA